MVVVAVVAAWLPFALAQLRTVTIDNLKPRLDTQGNIVDAHDGTVQVRCVQRLWVWAAVWGAAFLVAASLTFNKVDA